MSKITPDLRNLGAVVLCGGQSKRMGFDKWRLPLGKITLLQHVVTGLQSKLGEIVVAGGSTKLDTTDWSSVNFVADADKSSGPLEGIRAGLEFLSNNYKFAYVTACDIPNVNLEVIRFMLDNIGDHDAIIPDTDGRVYGMSAVYRTSIHSKIGQLIKRRKLRVSGLADFLNAKMISIDEFRKFDNELSFLKNINRPSDYLELLDSMDLECDDVIRDQLND